MTSFYVGAVIERPPGPKYHATLGFAELAPRPPLPKPKTLAKIPAQLPEGFALSLTAPRPCFVSERGPLRMDAVLEERLRWLADSASAVGAQAVVIPTLGEVRTGPRDRERLATYFEVLRGAIPNIPLVWEPGGLWDAEDAQPFAEKLGVVYAFDPLDAMAPGGAIAYLRIRGMGSRTRLGDGALTTIADAIQTLDADTVFVAIESPRSVREATRLRQLVEG